MNKITVVVFSLLMALFGGAIPLKAEPPALSIKQFYGVDVITNPLNIQPGFATVCTNWDLSKRVGVLTKRDGFRRIVGPADASVGQDYVGIFGYYTKDGDKKLFATYNTTSKWDYLGVSNSYDDSITTSNQFFLYKDKTPHWAMFGDVLVIANGKNRPFRYNGTNSDLLVDVPPGSADQHPVSHTGSQVLDGDYYYGIRAAAPDDNTFYYNNDSLNISGLSWKIHVDSDAVQIVEVPPVGGVAVSLRDGGDIRSVQICRTRNGSLHRDSMFLITTIDNHNGDNTTYLDTTPDDSLGVNLFYDGGAFVGTDTTDCTDACDSVQYRFPYIGKIDTSIFLWADTGIAPVLADSTTDIFFRLGQIEWIGTDTCTSGTGCVSGGIAKGTWGEDSSWIATRYTTVLFDTSTGMITQEGPVVRIPVAYRYGTPETDSIRDYAIRMMLPAVTSNQTHLMRLICRQKENIEEWTVTDTLFRGNPTKAEYLKIRNNSGWYCRWSDGSIDKDHSMRFQDGNGVYWCGSNLSFVDTIVTKTRLSSWRIIDTIKSTTDSTYTDSLNWSDFKGYPSLAFQLGWTLSPVNFPTIIGDRMYMASGNRVYYCRDGTVGAWDIGNAFDVNTGDGDILTALHSDGQNLNMFKNNSWYRATPIITGDEIIHSVTKVLSGIGCVAPHSIIDMPGGGFAFLHSSGIYALSSHLQSPYKESGGNLVKISAPIQPHLDKYSLSVLRECHAWISEDYLNLWFSFPTIDTSYVYSLNGGGWSKSSFAPRQTTKYDTTYNDDMRPGSDVYFIHNDLDSIMVHGNGYKYDNLDSITSTWRSGPLFVNYDYGKIIDYNLWKRSNVSDLITVQLFGDVDTALVSIVDSTQYRARKISPDVKSQFYFSFNIETKADSLAVERLELWYLLTGGSEGN